MPCTPPTKKSSFPAAPQQQYVFAQHVSGTVLFVEQRFLFELCAAVKVLRI